MNNPQYILNELEKGIKMGMDSLSNVSEKVKDTELKRDLATQYDEYNEILNKVNDTLKNYNEFPKEVKPTTKAMSWMGIQFNTMMDNSDSKIAEITIQGYNMGIIEGNKLLNNNPKVENNIKNLLNQFIDFQENSINKLKQYL